MKENCKYRRNWNLQNESICFMTKLRYKLMQDLLCRRKHPKILPPHLQLTQDYSALDAD